jgi:ApeA N-terminal domain 1
MVGAREYIGFWWLPTDDGEPPSKQEMLGGTLKIEDGAASLEVLESFGHEILSQSESQIISSPFPRDQPSIQGLTADGKSVTLIECLSLGSHMSTPGIPLTTYRPQLIVIGAWSPKNTNFVFDEVRIRTPDLDTWAQVSGFSGGISMKGDESGEHLTAETINIAYEPPEDIEIPLEHGLRAEVTFSFTYSGQSQSSIETTVKQRAYLGVRFAAPVEAAEVQAMIGQLRNFLSLAIGRPQTVVEVEARNDAIHYRGMAIPRPLEMLWELPHNPPLPKRAQLSHEMLFVLPAAKPTISDVMRAWFAHQQVLGPVLERYFGTLFHPDLFLDQRFMGYVQTVETYDRRRRDATELPKSEHRKWLRTVVNSAPKEMRERLNAKLAWSNELTLYRRILDVLGECPEVRTRLVGSEDDATAFARIVTDTRNYFTHLDPSLASKAATDRELYRLTVQLRAIIEMALLREVGFPCEAIDEILFRVGRYATVRQFSA